jgi:hypothetical protein
MNTQGMLGTYLSKGVTLGYFIHTLLRKLAACGSKQIFLFMWDVLGS